MTHIEQITEAMTALIGRSFVKSRGQSAELRNGCTTEEVIATLPAQIKDRREDIAKQLSEQLGKTVPIDVFEPWMVAHLVRLDAPIKGFSDKNAWRELRPDALVQIGAELTRREAAAMHWIVPLYLEHDDRLPDPEGFALWLKLLADGHSKDTVRGWIIDGFAK